MLAPYMFSADKESGEVFALNGVVSYLYLKLQQKGIYGNEFSFFGVDF